MQDFKNTNWWKYLTEPMKDLATESYALLDVIQTTDQEEWRQLHDYSFVVFPLAKAYEGFLKKLFFDLGFISKKQYGGERFRIGRALNPFLPKRYQWDWAYPKLVAYCGGDQLARSLWEVWKTARNQIFHYFPDHHEFVDRKQAKVLVEEIANVMEQALTGCKLS